MSVTPQQWFVEIIDRGVDINGVPSGLGGVVKRLGPYSSERTAQKAERGVSINLDHTRFVTTIVSE